MIRDIQGSLSARALGRYASLQNRMQGVCLHKEVVDKFLWK
jgi:hypothetical protein